jgi:5-methylcytosine-specific restriction enzyme A
MGCSPPILNGHLCPVKVMNKWKTVRKQILTRDDWKCVKCSGAANDVHHRKLKGMGGSKLLDTPANLISLCRTCHSWVHANPNESYKLGYMVHSWDDPENIPIGPCEFYF